MEEFYAKVDRELCRAEQLAGIYKELKELVCVEVKTDSNFDFIPQINFYSHWDFMPIVITIWNAKIEDVTEHVLRKIHEKYGYTFSMETYGEMQKVFWMCRETNDIRIQLLSAKECRWKEITKTSYGIDCTE